MKLLKESIILYVEDDEQLREQISLILSKIMKKVFISKNGQEAIEIFKNNKDLIDMVISDIDMPMINGIELLKEIRSIDKKIPFLLNTGHSEEKYLIESIKYNVSDYILKPINIKLMLEKITEICIDKNAKQQLKLKEQEITHYIDTFNEVAIVSKTDLKGNITYANNLFCTTSQYTREELIGKPHNIIRHPDMPNTSFKKLWEDIQIGKIWKGKVKNKAKDGTPYFTNATIFPIYNSNSKNITGYIGIRFLTTDDENEKREFHKRVILNIKENKEKEHLLIQENIDQNNKIIELTSYIKTLNEYLSNERKKNINKERQLTHYELQMKNIDDKFSNFTKNKNIEIEKHIKTNSQMKFEKENLIQKNEFLINKNKLLQEDNVRVQNQIIQENKKVQELEVIIRMMKKELKK